MGHVLTMFGIFVVVVIFFVSALALYQKFLGGNNDNNAETTETDEKKKTDGTVENIYGVEDDENKEAAGSNAGDENIPNAPTAENDESNQTVKYSPKILTIPITVMAIVLGLLSAANFALVIKELFAAGGGISFYKAASLAALSFNCTAVIGLLYIAAAAAAVAGQPNLALRLLNFTACSQVVMFVLDFTVFGFFSAPGDALPLILMAVAAVIVTAVSHTRAAFKLQYNELFWQDATFALLFIFIIAVLLGGIKYYDVNHPHSRQVWQCENFSFTGADADAGDTLEIYGFSFRLPKRFEITSAEHIEAGDIGSASGYDIAAFSDGSTGVSIRTRGGIFIEQLFEKTNIFNLPDALQYSNKFVYEPCGLVFLFVKALVKINYNYVISPAWSGYAEKQPADGALRTAIWSYSLWGARGNVSDAVNITFFFRDANDMTAAVKLVNNVISSLNVSRPEKSSGDLLKLAAAGVEQKNYAFAKIHLANALALGLKNAETHYYMALCLYSGGNADTGSVEFHLSRALQLDSSHAGALELRSKLPK